MPPTRETNSDDDKIIDEVEKEGVKIHSIIKFIYIYLSPPTFPTTLKQLSEKIFDKFSFKLPEHRLRKLLKYMNFSYKKGSSRVLQSEAPYLVAMRAIFSANILNKIYSNKVIINIDEVSI